MKTMQMVPMLAGFAVLAGIFAALSAEKPNPLAFTTEKEMKIAITSHIQDPRGTYNIMMRAYRQRLAPEATVVYEKAMEAKPDDPYLESAYAFSHYLATGDRCSIYLTNAQRNSPLLNELFKTWYIAERCRLDALRQKPNSPEVVLECAVGHFSMYRSYPVEESETQSHWAVKLMRRAQKLDPEWSEPYYFLGDSLRSHVYHAGPDPVTTATESLADLQKAEQMNPDWHVDCLIGSWTDYLVLKQWGKASAAIDAYIQARPKVAKEVQLDEFADALHKRLQKQQ